MDTNKLGDHIDVQRPKKVIHLLQALMIILVLASLISVSFTSRAQALKLGNRFITLGSPEAGATTTHDFSITINSTSSVGSILFEYCQESPLFDYTCTPPVGLDLSSAVLLSQSGETGFSIHASSTASKIVLTRTASVVVPGVSTYNFSNVINPTTNNTSSFVRIATYASDDASGSRIDEGGLAFAITNPLDVAAYVPPFIILCSGLTVSLDCSSTNGASIDLGNLDSNSVNAATAQFSVATNDDTGYNTFILGTTMTSGTYVITPNGSQTISLPGTSQFGINLTANTNPVVGNAPAGAGAGIVSGAYDDPNLFKFLSGDLISSSTVPTDFNRYTLSYIVNVPSNQAPGVYATTMTVLGAADF